jgi:error-prone DNA polymerase
MSAPTYIELHARSAFSFLRGGSLPEHLAERAGDLDLPALGVCDRMGVYGAPRFFSAARERGLRPIIGAELALEDGPVLPVLVESRRGYQNLCRLLTQAHLRAAAKNEGVVRWEELPEFAAGLVALTGDEEGPLGRALLNQKTNGGLSPEETLRRLVRIFGPNGVFVEIQRHLRRGEDRIQHGLMDLARAFGLPLLATNGVLHASSAGRQVVDVFTCLRHHTHLDAAGRLLSINAERQLKSAREMTALFADLPEATANSVRLAERLQFTLADLGYEFPKYPVGPGETMEGVLRDWALRGARERYAGQVPEKIRGLLEKELALINKLGFAGYFLIVADLVRYCREQNIMAQGRGSAANSAVCFCLGITAVDPVKFNVLFERFLSEGRKGWPDIDIDLPSGDHREQVIQEVYRRYAPHGAAMTANVITYRGRSTAREAGKVLNLPADVLDRFSSLFANGDFPHTLDLLAQMEKAGLARSHPRAPAFATLYQQLRGLPRHLGQHSGGMIICQGQLSSIVPLEKASMPGRVVAQWDKDDCEDLGIIKVDLLGLGMMAVLQDAVTLTQQRGHPVDLAQLPENDAKTYELMRRADTIGVFQIESRAQMATLPRLKPEIFYDLVIEVAIIRPGPIVGDLAHPYLRRRNQEEAIDYYAPELKPVLERTLGIPLFQEQMLQMAMVMAHFTGDEAEDLRRAMSFHRSEEKMLQAQARLRAAMDRAGVPARVAEQVVQAVGSFALYGFPESHAISFAHLAYASAYLKVHRAPEFFCALLNNQPMGFYSPATLVRDAKRRGIQVRPVCVARSNWECLIEPDASIRLGFLQVEGIRREHALAALQERMVRPFASLDDFKARTSFGKDELRTLAETGALNCFAPHRRAAMWEAERTRRDDDLFGPAAGSEGLPMAAPLRMMNSLERLRADYAGLRLTTGQHPMGLIRERLPDICRAADLPQRKNGERIRVAGQVICRQRPGTAKGVCFVSLEDETGISNAIVAPTLFETERLTITAEPFLVIEGILQSRQGVIHIQARSIHRLDYAGLETADSHDFG